MPRDWCPPFEWDDPLRAGLTCRSLGDGRARVVVDVRCWRPASGWELFTANLCDDVARLVEVGEDSVAVRRIADFEDELEAGVVEGTPRAQCC